MKVMAVNTETDKGVKWAVCFVGPDPHYTKCVDVASEADAEKLVGLVKNAIAHGYRNGLRDG